MLDELNTEDYTELIEIAQSLSPQKVEVWVSFKNLYIRSESIDIMIRNNSWGNNRQLVLARIYLKEQRKGSGTKIIKWLENFAKENEINLVKIESIESQEMLNLALKLGYTIENNYCGPDEFLFQNYIKTV